ncbi:hypothetical protein DPMN_082413 [Dreissena polymorpha]|uniref:Uncharacterized protein n=1 Tax=Dreissena polymorpha TaxID=45954 RepID=A0A9D3YAR1_DREPO|nr:hypothetical protein DPMN_082413 [Dreissena polymorpha]
MLEQRARRFEEENVQPRTTIDELRCEKETYLFSVENLKPMDFPFYTGFPSKEVFYAVLQLVNPGEHGENIILVPQRDDAARTDQPKLRKPRKNFSCQPVFPIFVPS